ncbi:MAG TPA: methyltransferase MtaB domain-containing protein [Candidatus Limnocylindrales bacterium]|nr:methyltransferase MtaB domain-containing protein [Candidatus Limnocylindrales bacterium]
MESYSRLATSQVDQLVFGRCPRPLTLRSGLTIGGGTVYPELNFTLPVMSIEAGTMSDVRAQYAQMIEDACKRAVELNAPGLVVEFELLPELTLVPEWGAEVTALLRETLDRTTSRHGLKSGLRVTPNDIREFTRPPLMREGEHWDNMVRSFHLCAHAGADMLSIESTGGKEIHDGAIQMANLPAVVFALGILGCRDMAFLWDMIVDVAHDHGCVAAGDTACGFGNTAMMLAEIRYIPRVWAALIRVLTVTRSLVAYERGAVGPSKDCAYEGPYIKAITGYPIALEGAEAACAHFSPVGNITKAYADLWSNESVQNVKLLGGMAPTVSLEQLTYAARLMNTASAQGPSSAIQLRDLFVESDSHLDPQAYVLRPDVVIQLAGEIIQEETHYLRTRRAALATLDLLRTAHHEGRYLLPANEVGWLDRLQRQADRLPEDESVFVAEMLPTLDRDKVRLDQYDLA